jgi:thiamine monophosphate synthase
MDGLLAMGARNIAMIRGITEAEDVMARTEDFKGRIREDMGE